MAEQSTVEILLQIKAKQEELQAVREQLKGLNGDVATAQATTSKYNAEIQALSVEQQKIGDVLRGNRSTIGAIASDFAPATAAQRAYSLRAEEAAASTAKTAASARELGKDLGYVSGDIASMIPGAQGLGKEIQYLGRDFGALGEKLGLMNTLMAGAGIGAALAFAAALAKITETGVELQKTLQGVGEGVTGTLTTESTRFGGGAAQQAGAQSIEKLVEVAKQAQVPISELAKAFDQINPAATRANASINQQIQLVAGLTAQSGALHIPQQRLITDLEQIFNGNIRNTNQLAQRLDLDKQQVIQARESGTITDLLIQKEEEYAKAHEDGSTTIERAQQKVQAAWEQLALAASKPIVQPLTKALNDMAAAMNDPAIAAGASYIIGQFEAIIAKIVQVIQWCQQVGQAIVSALQAAASFAVSSAGQVFAGGAVTEGDTSGGFNIPSGGSAVVTGRVGGAGLQMGGSQDYMANLPPGVLARQPGVSAPPGGYPKGGGGRGGGGGGGKGPSLDTQDAEQMKEITSEITNAQERYNAAVEQNTADHQLGKKSLSEENAANHEAGNQYIVMLDQQRQKLIDMRAKIQDLGTAQGSNNVKEETQINNLEKAIAKLDIQKQKILLAQQGQTWAGQFQKEVIKLGDSFQLTGQKAAQFFGQSLQTGIGATSNALTGLIFQTKNWQQAFISAGESIVDQLIKIALQAVIGAALADTIHASERLTAARTAASNAWSSAAGIPLFGWIIAPFAAAAAYAGAIAFEEGGIVPGGYSSSDNRLAMVRSGEGILTPSAVAAIGGPSVIHTLNHASPRFADGGVVGGIPNINLQSIAAQQSQQSLHFAFFDDRQALGNWMRGRDGRKIVVDHARSAAHEIGIPQTLA